MAIIQGLGGAAPANGGRRVGRGKGFQLTGPTAATETPAAMVTAAVDLGGLLAAQEGWGETARDRSARRQGRLMLDLLRALQCATLGKTAEAGAETLVNLADLAAKDPAADDPALAAVLRAIRVRAAVELARRERP